jgi:predicted HTH domain antitoxin
VLAISSTGRWILIEYTEPFNLERRVGWIRKKYAKLQSVSQNVSQDKLRLILALNLYKVGELSLGQAAEAARLTKRQFIDVLGNQHIPVLNYSAGELREEIGV